MKFKDEYIYNNHLKKFCDYRERQSNIYTSRVMPAGISDNYRNNNHIGFGKRNGSLQNLDNGNYINNNNSKPNIP